MFTVAPNFYHNSSFDLRMAVRIESASFSFMFNFDITFSTLRAFRTRISSHPFESTQSRSLLLSDGFVR